uniref:AtxE2 n=1 Tax=Asticcacaulis excentricus (strain ATCC 15261 / DSM 4724 / KCTC 12464 / NCIMB 9791 / VKM B-1370 / CB 48) TaxID=573065 RepID=UPI00093886B9|nr:Chain A, AtxE2 [Asticcacaulis excentricus CB 48]5TXE_B Chain B, AtxE2 [Asticcacaulis excentricus CB 48]
MRSSKIRCPGAIRVGTLVTAFGCLPHVAFAAAREAPPVTPEVLVRLADIGTMSASETTPLLSLSPDGRYVAFQVRQADPVTNLNVFRMVVKATDGATDAIDVDVGGEYLFWTIPSWGYARNAPSGANLTIQPRWSPSGTHLAYLRQDQGRVRVWRASVKGEGASPVIEDAYDIEDVQWLDDNTLIYSGRPGFVEAEAEIEREGRRGWVYDERFHPLTGARPRVLEPISIVYQVLDLKTGTRRAATPTEVARLREKPDPLRAMVGRTTFSVSRTDPQNINAPTTLVARRGEGEPVRCDEEACQNITRMWGDETANVLYFLRREGWASNEMALYRMPADALKPVRIWHATGLLQGCERQAKRLICAQESALQPRRLVTLNLTSGQMSPLYDPNPDLSRYRLPKVERLTLRNRNGIEVFSDLVLPPDYQLGTRLPLVIVQYSSRGFLRGGTGDENPILPLATAGFAVLSFHSPRSEASYQRFTSPIAQSKAEYSNWRNRWNILHTLEDLIDDLDRRGVIDPARVGLTGLADGATTVHFGLINSHRFAAAVTSSCCTDSFTASVMNGPRISGALKAYGIETDQADDGPFWAATSFVVNASRLDTPLLIQSADEEYLGALPGFTALQQARKPVELIIYPNEHHVKWQPAHRLAVYNRTIDWFRFWLMDQSDPAPDKAAQYDRWRALRALRQKSPSPTPAPGSRSHHHHHH